MSEEAGETLAEDQASWLRGLLFGLSCLVLSGAAVVFLIAVLEKIAHLGRHEVTGNPSFEALCSSITGALILAAPSYPTIWLLRKKARATNWLIVAFILSGLTLLASFIATVVIVGLFPDGIR